MKLQFIAGLAMAGLAIAQGVTDKIAPEGDAPAGCQPNAAGKFEITVIPLTKKAKKDSLLENRAACSGDGTVVVQLADGVLTDAQGRTGYIASNYQLQFDNPPQSGALYTAGFSACGNGSLALGDSTVFWQCASGTFYNLYDRWSAEQCSPVHIISLPCGSDSGGGNDQGGASQTVVGTRVVTTTIVIPLGDGQPQVITTTTLVPICQIQDGQLQAHTTPCAAATTPTAATSLPPVSQISDGQVQVTPGPSSGAGGDSGSDSGSGSGSGSGGAGGGGGGGAQETVPTTVPTAAPPLAETGGAAALGGGGWVGVGVAVVAGVVVRGF
ncbi:putative covalently-linked cell wall protein [Chaetomium sp. MPI-CAGE-AT-0009]|nr:putative covalently-linked cell wall protein [Chaetomium sp. MPI-CAGE-AT-0009]